jgi:predicted alpha/beta-hydrolase family hydrolase
MHTSSVPVTFALEEGGQIPGLLDAPAGARCCFVFAHGAGAGMDHAFMAAIAEGLAHREIATFRFQFPYIVRGSRRPDPPGVAQATVRAAVREASRRMPGLPVFAGGKSYGGRMTTQAQAAAPLDGVRGIVLLGFPLHPAGKPSTERADHLDAVRVPMLFLQGTRDALAEPGLLRPVVEQLGERATLHRVDAADHSFHVLARSGRSDIEARAEVLDAMAAWMTGGPTTR